ncbi:outer membrane protein assembly factor BamB [Streptomyces achromogenes]|uniref:Outer membrane protein assembly factor BamB n=1 Tax=Streptomyces achromogenes TaxID=67255 RepID=A0ABU0QDW3_STRAH|nr:PQQ-binding-like beta-propeller repeat protein [Streptomyces achromogenes]MDQ0688855.1 outer membrane protein assembly factor BamB [Streptomyces achromogenes]
MARVARLVMPVGVALSLVAACGGGSGDDHGRTEKGRATTSSSPAPKADSYDPPLKFVSQGSTVVPGGTGDGPWSFRLEGVAVYAVSDAEVKAVSALDGTRLWSVKPQGEPTEHVTYSHGDKPGQPTLVTLDGRSAVLAAFPVTVPGAGTTPDRNVIELTALAADSGKRLWTTTVERPERQQEGNVILVGSDGTTAALKIGKDTDALTLGDPVTLGIALDTHKTVWTASGFAAKFIDDGVVVGLGDSNPDTSGDLSVQGLGLADGKKAWTHEAPKLNTARLDHAGSGLFTAEMNLGTVNDDDSAVLLSTATGRVPDGAASVELKGSLPHLSCWLDAQATIVCDAWPGLEGGRRHVFALDARTFKELWSIEEGDSSRLLPSISSAWHGAVYGSTTNGPVILDARTGKDKATDPGITPSQVNAHAGLVEGRTGVEVYRATA